MPNLDKKHLFLRLFYPNGSKPRDVYGRRIGAYYLLESQDGERDETPCGVQVFAPGFIHDPFSVPDRNGAAAANFRASLFEFSIGHLEVAKDGGPAITFARKVEEPKQIAFPFKIKMQVPCPIFRFNDQKKGRNYLPYTLILENPAGTRPFISLRAVCEDRVLPFNPTPVIPFPDGCKLDDAGLNDFRTKLKQAITAGREFVPSIKPDSFELSPTEIVSELSRVTGAEAAGEDVAKPIASPPNEVKAVQIRGRWEEDAGFFRPLLVRRYLCSPNAFIPLMRGDGELLAVWRSSRLGSIQGPGFVLDFCSDRSLSRLDTRYYDRLWKDLVRTFHARLESQRTFLFEIAASQASGPLEPARFLVDAVPTGIAYPANPANPRDYHFDLQPHVPQIGRRGGGPVTVFLRFPSFSPRKGSTYLKIQRTKAHLDKAEWHFSRPDGHLVLEMPFGTDSIENGSEQPVRMGALDCFFGGKNPPQSASHARFSFRVEKTAAQKRSVIQKLVLEGYSLGFAPEDESAALPGRETFDSDGSAAGFKVVPLCLPLRDLMPGATDRGDEAGGLLGRGDRPFILPYSTEKPDIRTNEPSAYLLKLTEAQSIVTRQELDIRIFREGENPIRKHIIKLLYLDRNPFLVGQLEMDDLRNFEPGKGNELAYWSTRGAFRGWQLKATGRNFQLVLPPQVLAEEMEKIKGQEDIGENEAADIRFTTPARLKLRSSDLVRNYGIVPWDIEFYLNSIRDSRLVGLPLESAEFELLYGLKTSLESRSRLRVAELFARFGFPSDRLPAQPRSSEASQAALQKEYECLRKRWDKRLRTFENRLAIYELFEEDQIEFDADGKLAGLNLTGKRGKGGPQARLIGSSNTSPKQPAMRASFRIENPLPRLPIYDTEGLAGGFAWAFESYELLKALYNPPPNSETSAVEAVETTVARLFFSALGGWGSQEAVFDQGKARLMVSVEMGRVSELRVERVGRVGLLWNKAKMVTIFRRTVAPTDQFKDEQDAHLGRPILRKAEEYIEFIEKYRRHPDMLTQEADDRLPGCLCGSSCEEKILVNSRWGAEVFSKEGKALGWKVPFRRASDPSPVYGPANVFLHFHSNPDSLNPIASARIENLHDLWFWTDLDPATTADTDLWDPQPGIDFGNFAVPGKEPRPLNGGPDAWGSPPSAAGTGPFTFRLGGFTGPVNLAARVQRNTPPENRTNVSVKLRYFTMTRGEPLQSPSNVAPGPLNLAREAGEQIAGLLEQLPLERAWREGDPTRDDVVQAIKNLASKFDEGPKKTIDSALSKIGESFGNIKDLPVILAKEVTSAIRWQISQGSSDLLGLGLRVGLQSANLLRELESLDDIDKAVQRASEEIAAIKSDLLAIRSRACIPGFFGKMIEEFDDAVAKASSLDGMLGDFIGRIQPMNAKAIRLEIDDLLEFLRQSCSPLVNGGSSVLGALACKFDTTRAISVLRQASARVAGALRRNEELQPARDWLAKTLTDLRINSIPPLLQALKDARSTIDNAVGGIPDTIVYLEIEKRIEKLKQLEDQIAAIRNKDLLLRTLRKDLGDTASTIEKEAAAWVKGELNGLDTNIKDALVAIIQGPEIHDLNIPVERLREALHAFEGDFRQIAEHLREAGEIAEWVDARREAIASAIEGIPAALRRVGEEAGEILQRPGKALRAVRALGTSPEAALLQFKGMTNFAEFDSGLAALDRQINAVGYVFRDVAKELEMTSVIAMVDNVEDYTGRARDEIKMKAAELALPVNRIGEQIKADFENIKKQAKDQLFKSLAGLKKWVRGGIGSDLADRIEKASTLETKFDPKTMTGFVDSRIVSLRLGEDTTIFSFGPISLRLRDPVLDARAYMRKEESGIRKTSTASITADWEMSMGGQMLFRFRKTRISCEDGKIRMDLDPSRLELSGVMQALADLAKRYEDQDGPFRFGVIPDLPRKIEAFCEFDVTVPPVQMGTFGITNLSFGASMRIALDCTSADGGFDLRNPKFLITTGLNLSKEKAPFSIIVFILGGCGWFDVRARYEMPLGEGSPALAVDVSIAVGAAASIGINLGFISGSVYVSLAIEIRCTFRTNGPNDTRWSVVLTFAGQVSVLGLVTVSLLIVLAMRYSSNGGLVGSGHVSIRIKICWCIKIKVEKSFDYEFRKSNSSGSASIHRDHHRLAPPSAPSHYPWERVPGPAVHETASRETVRRNTDSRRNRPNFFA